MSDGAPDLDLAALLGGATRDVFENVFAFSLGDLQDVKALDKEGLKARLYAAGAGTGARSLPEVREALDKEAKGDVSRGSGSALAAVAAEIRRLRDLQESLRGRADRYGELQRAHAELATELAVADGTERAAAGAMAAQRALLDAWGDWTELQQRRAALVALGDVAPMAPGAEEKLRAAKQAVEERRGHAQAAEARLTRAQADLDSACTRLGDGWTEARLATLDAGDSAESEIGASAHALADASAGLARADQAAAHGQEALAQASSARTTLEEEERRRWPAPPRAMDTIETDLSTLREARAAATRLAEERAGRTTLEARRQGAEDDLKRLRVAPEPVAQVAHIPLIVTFGLLAASGALVSFSPIAAGVLFAVFLVAATVTVRLQGRARSVVRAQRHDEIAEAEGKLRDVDDKLAAADEAIAKQLGILAELGRMIAVEPCRGADDLEPAETRLLAERDSARALAEFSERLRGARKAEAEAADTAEAGRVARAAAAAELEARKTHWARWLEARSMPPTLAPDTALQFVEQIRAARGLANARDARRAEFAEAAQRITEAEAGVAAVIAEAGDADEAGFRLHLVAWANVEATRREIAVIHERLLARAGSEAGRAEIEKALGAADEASLRVAVEAAQRSHADARAQADALRKREGEIANEMRSLESANDAEAVGIALSEQTSLAEDILSRWAVKQLCIHLLNEARLKFERERQPAVVRRAGEHLRSITGGAYARVLRRLGGAEIEAETASGELKCRAAWNRGLLEQIYLCLRLGYIEDYCATSEPLPIVMDDVFANFDPEHARRAAHALAECAESRQILYMTCHPETVAHFREAAGARAAFYRLEDGKLRADL
jgi:uncharacterized protein YhaN